jgi:dCMP deaminase
MDQITSGIHQVYETREKYIIIGLTGRTGSGCTTTAGILKTPRDKLKITKPQLLGDNENETRKFHIIKRFIENNWIPFDVIEIKNIITSFVLEIDKSNFIKYIADFLEHDNEEKKKIIIDGFIKECGEEYDLLRNSRLKLQKREFLTTEERHQKNKKFYFNDLPSFTEKFKECLDNLSSRKYTKIFQKIGDNIRSSGNAISDDFKSENIFAISKRVNRLLKIFTYQSRKSNKKTFIVIDTLRNPFEALYFRERYSAFYLMALNTEDSTRKDRLQIQYDLSSSEISNIDKKESNKIKSKYSDFVSQNIQKCYDLADIHVSNPQLGLDDFTYLKWQITKFVALIMHPGIIMPSSVERCMQIANTSKLNSGCLSRQVGACVTNDSFSVKAIGWNTPPEGQTPCSLRNVYDLLSHKDDKAFSYFEKNNQNFRDLARNIFDKDEIKERLEDLKGRNVSYCFKDIKNELDKGKNQVHTRALHAEENAFLQIVKYGGQSIIGGKLFTTSSPCELCSKKAYQLGIKEIYFIDPYPGISESHILQSGINIPKLTMFSGAIGRAYHQIYEPIMPVKDEINSILKIESKDFYNELKEENQKLKKELELLKRYKDENESNKMLQLTS